MAEGADSRFAAIHEDYLSCKICFEELDQPKSLPCLHTFCLKCIEQHAKGNRQPNNTFACPLCRNDCQIPEKGIQGFPTNFMVQGLKDVVKFPREEEEERDPTIMMCQNHPLLESNWFCFTCFQPICHECKEGYHKKKKCDCRDKNQAVSCFFAYQQTEISTLENHLEKCYINCREITSTVNHIQATKQKFKEEANLKYSEIEKKLNDEKKSLHNEIDQHFGKETELKECLENIKEFEEQMNATKKEISEIKNPEFTKNGLENYQKCIKLRKSSQTLQEKYSLVTKARILTPSKTRLAISEDVMCTIMERPLVKLETYVDTSNIKYSLISEFSIKLCGEDRAAVRDLLCIHSKIYALMDEDTNIKMFHTHGMFLGVFQDKFSFEKPCSFCCLPNDTIAVSYKYVDTIKVFDLEGNFRRRINIDISGAILAALPDGTIAVGDIIMEYIDIYTQKFKRRTDKEIIGCGAEPLHIHGNKDALFYSDRENVYSYVYKGDFVYNLSETIDKFDPRGMCIDKWGNLLVTNRNYSKINSFSLYQRFQIKVLLDQRNNKLHHPVAVCFTEDNELIVGQENGKIKVFSYSENQL